jgi:hypothetical protein
MRTAWDDDELEGEVPANVACDWAREWAALKEGRRAAWLAAVRWCYRYEPWKVEPFMAMRARERPEDPVAQATIALAFALLAGARGAAEPFAHQAHSLPAGASPPAGST